MIGRRSIVAGATLATLLGGTVAASPAAGAAYGSVGRIRAKPGQGAALAAAILGGTTGASAMPGCRAYIVAADQSDADLLWVFEAWESKAAHDASLSLPGVRAAIAKGRPLIAGFEAGADLRVLGGLR